MGHTRLGSVPKSARWSTLVACLASDGEGKDTEQCLLLQDDISSIARETLRAVELGLEQASQENGLRYIAFLMIKVILAARAENSAGELEGIGIRLSEKATLFDLTSQLHGLIDDYLTANGCITDISEIAQQAAGETLSQLAAIQQMTLFGSSRDNLLRTLRNLSTKKGFSQFSQKFFGSFLSRFLNFYLSRVTAAHVGGSRLHNVGDLSQFNKNLKKHCEESARILYDFSGAWFSKAIFEGGIDFNKVSGFVSVALEKLRSEMKQQRSEL